MQEDQAEEILAECRKQRGRTLRWTVISVALVLALVVAAVFAAANGRYHGLIVVLVPVLLVVNLMRLAQYAVALRKIKNAERLVHEAQSRLSQS